MVIVALLCCKGDSNIFDRVMESCLLVLVLVPSVLSQGGEGDLPDPRCPVSSRIKPALTLGILVSLLVF